MGGTEREGLDVVAAEYWKQRDKISRLEVGAGGEGLSRLKVPLADI